MKRRRQIRWITLPAKPKRSPNGGRTPSICLDCMEPIDLDLVIRCIVGNIAYSHPCGRVLVSRR